MALPDRTEHMALALLASLQADPAARIVQATNPLVPYLQGSFDLKRAVAAAVVAGGQWDAAAAAQEKPAEPTTPSEVSTGGVGGVSTSPVPSLGATAATPATREDLLAQIERLAHQAETAPTASPVEPKQLAMQHPGGHPPSIPVAPAVDVPEPQAGS